MVFDEDSCRKRKDNAAENFNLIRKAALNSIKDYKGDNKSYRRRRLYAAWNQQYLEQLLKSRYGTLGIISVFFITKYYTILRS